MSESEKKKDFRQMFNEEQQQTETAKKAFNIDDFIVDPTKIEEKYVPNVGTVRFKRLTVDELREFNGIKDNYELGLRMLARMLNKADPSVTYEKLAKADMLAISGILQALVGNQTRFLQ